VKIGRFFIKEQLEEGTLKPSEVVSGEQLSK
jgi:hypothetical protein